MFDDRNSHFRFGSAAFARAREIAKAGMFKQTPDALFLGFAQDGRPLWYNDAGGLLLCAGARSGKLRDILGYNICNRVFSRGSMLVLDMKGELAAISQDQTPDQKFCAYWNPLSLHGLPKMRINPVSYLRKDSPHLFADVKVYAENAIPLSGSTTGQFFELRAREFLEAVILTLVMIKGVLTLAELYRTLNLIHGNSEAWLAFAYEMHISGIALAASIEEEIAVSREDSTGGFRGIMGELLKSFSCLSDPVLLESVSPHPDGRFDFDLADMCSDDQFWHFYMMPPAEFIHIWAPIIKFFFVGARVLKSRAPQAPRQTWIIDEAAQLKNFPLLVQMFTYGAGIGIRPWAIYQSISQMNATGDNARSIITSSAAVRSYFAVRDLESANAVSHMLGKETLEYDDPLEQGRAHVARQQLAGALMRGEDPLQAGLKLRQVAYETRHRSKQSRSLRTPDEILNMAGDEQIIFVDGLSKPIHAKRAPYYEQAFMAGRYHPNPYHPPLNKVRVRSRSGRTVWRKVVRKPVPRKYAHYPQYADGFWSKVKG